MHIEWNKGLPEQYAAAVIAPFSFEHFEDDLASARKFRGFDTSGCMCYYRHAYSRTAPRLDDEDCFHESETYYEEVIAWRLENGSWLVRRYEASGEEGHCGRRLAAPSYAVVDAVPR